MGGSPGTPNPTDVTVRPIMQQIIGMSGTNNLVPQIIPAVSIISVATFRPGAGGNTPEFSFAPNRTGRLGIFAARKGNSERAVILLLPASGAPDRVLIGITHGFAQNTAYYEGKGWRDPLSRALIEDVLLRFVVNRWGAQTLAGKKNMAFLLIVRAAGRSELGPFANDGPFVAEALRQMASLTGNAFSYDHVEVFTYSSGINELNVFLPAISPVLNVETIYAIDPAGARSALRTGSALRKQYLSGQTGGPSAGFEYMPLNRWRNEDRYGRWQTVGLFNYLHNWCMPSYILHLGIQTS